MKQPATIESSRLAGVDTFRVLAALAIVFGRASELLTFAPTRIRRVYPYVHEALCYVTQFAVPFFLLASGYFFGKSLMRGTPATTLLVRRCARLRVVFFA